ncbi:MAG: hypothetical protein IJV17_06650 [Prevotella sp.]|nr:hypothetical protein [Prevotella sp.]
MRHLIYILTSLPLLLFASCGPQAEAEQLVEQFMEQNMREDLKPSSVHFTDIDSTHAITDSIIISLRQTARQAKRYQPKIQYAPDEPFRKLIITRVRYDLGDEECSDTYYLDMELTRVVAFKEN